MPRGQRSFSIPETNIEKTKWKKQLDRVVKHVLEDDSIKRPQLDTWAAIDEWGFTPEEFRLLYSIARHEQWKGVPGNSQKKERKNGCYASAQKLSGYTGISRNKIFEILALFQEANIVQKLEEPRSRTGAKRGRPEAVTLAGWTYEYVITPINTWMPPWELAEARKAQQEKKKAKRTQTSTTT